MALTRRPSQCVAPPWSPWLFIQRHAGLEGVRLHDRRHTFCDAALAGGIRQVAILGAGLDTFAFRERSFRTRRLLLAGAAATLFAPRLHAAAASMPPTACGSSPCPFASPEAARLAFPSGSVDTIVQPGLSQP